MSTVRVAIAGCSGRMGRALVRLALEDAQLQLAGALTIDSDPLIGQDAAALAGVAKSSGVIVSSALNAATCDVLVDFTTPAGCRHWADWCGVNGVALVSGTTGISAAERAALDRASERIGVVWSANMSVGVNLLARISGEVAAALGDGWDIEIVEAHHRHKADAPSGTAKLLLESICKAISRDASAAVRNGREGMTGARTATEIGMHAVRLGGIVGDHDVHFATPGEMVTLSHRALSRDTFAAGALRAAKWVCGRQAGRYSMQDVLFGR